MKISKFIFIVGTVIYFVFSSTVSGFCYQDSLTHQEEINVNILEDKLEMDEIENVKNAVDKALTNPSISNKYSITSEEILNNLLKGNPLKSLEGLPNALLSILGKEVKANIALIIQLFAVMLIGAVIRAMQPKEGGLSNEAARLAVNGVLIIIASVSFGSMVDIARSTIDSMQQISSLAMPAMLALMASSGKIVSVAAIQPIMFVIVNGINYLFKVVLLPVTVMAGVLFLVDGISERFKLKTLAKLLKSIAVWATGIMTLILSILVSVQKIASSSVDAVTIRTTKFALGTFIPVAGKYMADAAETILMCTSAASNFVGILTIIGLGVIFAIPFIKVFVIMISFRLAASFGAPICDEAICDALEDSADCFSVMMGIMGASLFGDILLAGTMMQLGGVIT
ncbi:MAG: stage III sporulation protein AE [Acetivibrionales bacterium]|jgi:stage III sporulation protein AE|nr:hypothetical protein [Clostridiaceae bacterium]